MALRERIIHGFRAELVGQTVQMVSKGVLILLLSRVFLSPGEYGLLFLAMSILGVAIIFANLGLAKSGARYLAEFRERDPGQVRHILVTTLAFNALTATAVAVALVALSTDIARVIGEAELAPFLVVGAGYVVFRSFGTYLRLSFQGFNRVDWGAVVGIVSSVGMVGFVVGLLWLDFGALGALVGYTAGYALAAAVGGVVLYLAFYRQFPRSGSRRADLPKRILRYSIPLTATSSAGVLDKRVDTILIGFFLTPVAVGFYTLGKQLTEFLITPAKTLGFTIAPVYGEQKAKENLERAARLYETSVEHIVLLYVPAAAGLVLVAEPMVRFVVGSDYLGAVPVIQIFSVYILLRAVDKVTNDGLDYLGRARARAMVKGGTATANFLLNLLLIPLFGIIGAAVATVVTTALLVGFELYIIHAELPLEPATLGRTLSRIAAITLVMSAVVAALRPYIADVLSLLGVALVGLLVWFALVTASGMLRPARIRAVFS